MGPEHSTGKEVIGRGQLCFLSHPDSEMFSGYGLTTEQGRKDRLVGLLMVDRPQPVDPTWLKQVEDVYGECDLVPMTAAGERGILTQMRIEADSLPFLQPLSQPLVGQIENSLQPLLERPPTPILKLRWNQERGLWDSRFWIGLPLPLQKVFERSGYGCLAVEREDAVAFVTHVSDADIASLRNAKARCRWELVAMPTAPLIRFRAALLDNPYSPYVLEHFLNVDDHDQARSLSRLVKQEALTFDLFGDGYEYAYSSYFPHPPSMRQDLHRIVRQAIQQYGEISARQRDFDRAKALFQRRFAI